MAPSKPKMFDVDCGVVVAIQFTSTLHTSATALRAFAALYSQKAMNVDQPVSSMDLFKPDFALAPLGRKCPVSSSCLGFARAREVGRRDRFKDNGFVRVDETTRPLVQVVIALIAYLARFPHRAPSN
ncbi:hypothetical protein Krac_9731 [Ktedonobacter racemifer DSM 44963]|uniref:Uncharacterized protein n=1 Tax=Ktedonobacter racemifer DSM 44963 TaxID=485913 RepID=D6TDF8_KTERA|nr:hypothetical protein Krac_9731 [Ktedonobacter racemifer DSM 44963]